MRKLTSGSKVVACALALAAGCSTVDRAHEAQEAARARAEGAPRAAARADLRDYTLERLVAFAMTNRPSVVLARLAVDDARLALKALAADAPLVSDTPWTAPQLSLSGGHAESSSGSTYGNSDHQTHGSPSAALSLELLVWDFGRHDAKARAQVERVLAAERTLVDEGFAVFEDVAAAYFTHLERRALCKVALKNEFEYAEHLRRAEERLKAGEAQKLDVLKAKLDLATATEAVVTASNLVMTSGATLMGALGIDVSRGTFREVLGPSGLPLGTVRRGFALSDAGAEECFAFARTNAPSMQIARAQLRAASGDVDYAIRDLLPKASVTLSASWADPLWAWSWGVSAVQSLFEGFRRTTAIDRAVVALKTAASEVDKAELDLSLSLQVAVANRDNSVKGIETARASVASAKENLDMVRQQLQVGSVSRIELSEAISSHSTALGSAISAFYEGQIAEARLYRLIGSYPVYRDGTERAN